MGEGPNLAARSPSAASPSSINPARSPASSLSIWNSMPPRFFLPPTTATTKTIETWSIDWAMHDWSITTWSNHKMSTSREDWHMDSKVKASDTSMGSELKAKMLNCGLLSSSPSGRETRAPERALQNVMVSYPATGIDYDVVYLQARLRFEDPKAFVLTLDTRNNALLGAVEFATETKRGDGVVYFRSNIHRYIDPEDRFLRITKGDDDEDDSARCLTTS
ncbi:hypothetical protein ACP70R_032554 [Stipagrostis hirtigluma subsp. patula]